ncbi:hypothetical protein BOTCAL_0582g00090 [Botryotinia calthae]|uniref:Uncharacterized protein n=1 Tax=Botryotinia calthae TaxID=38488 RepID=A0A4Y8CJD9_9HELO|nr:hypothetical protein BOTCAL_0582g00090 [Botryotinia calthae]
MNTVTHSHQPPIITPALPDYCIRVAFKCQSCTEPNIFEIKRCDKAVQSNTWYHPCEQAVIIKVARQASMCKSCWGSADALRIPIWKAMYHEGQKISSAFLETFENLGRLGYKLKGGHHEDIRAKGTVVWIKRLADEIPGTEDYFPWRASLDNLSDEIAKPKCIFGGRMSIASAMEDRPECVEIMRRNVVDIKEKTDAAGKFLEERGFMIEGQILGWASASYGDLQAERHLWGFLRGNEVGKSGDDGLVEVHNFKNGKTVRVMGVGK